MCILCEKCHVYLGSVNIFCDVYNIEYRCLKLDKNFLYDFFD